MQHLIAKLSDWTPEGVMGVIGAIIALLKAIKSLRESGIANAKANEALERTKSMQAQITQIALQTPAPPQFSEPPRKE